jgi:hypothetical protein
MRFNANTTVIHVSYIKLTLHINLAITNVLIKEIIIIVNKEYEAHLT